VTIKANGSKFELFFPITRKNISRKDLSIPFNELKGDGEKILVIDDVASQRDISCRMLETFGYITKSVASGKETQKLGAGKYIKKPLTIEKIGLAVKAEIEK